MNNKATYSCQNPVCRRIHHNSDICPECGCEENDLYEVEEEEETES